MTSPPSQPSIADAARLMDALSFASHPTPPGSGSSTNLFTCSAHVKQAPLQAQAHASGNGTLGSHGQSPPSVPLTNGPPSHLGGTTQPSTSSATDSIPPRRIPSLPLEIIFHIATQLLTKPDLYHVSGIDARPAAFPCRHSSPPYSPLPLSRADLPTLLALSSASRTFRQTLLPLVWHTLVIRTPQHLPRLATLLRSYDTLSIRSTSPSRTRQQRSSPDLETALRHPLPYIRSIIVSIPDKYIDLDQSFLLTLLRSMHLSQTRQLEHLYWSAEAVPNPAIWPLIAPSVRSLEVDGRTFYHGHSWMGGLERLEVLTMVRYESTLLPLGARMVFERQRAGGGEGVVEELPEGAEAEERRNRGTVESPVLELQRSVTGEPQRQARHLYLDPPNSAPPTLPPLAISSSRTRLTHLSLSSSKTSLLHQPALIASSAFTGLTHLDIYPVTPEPPLSTALLSTASTLTHLRLILDVSGAFDNYNALWSDLTGYLPRLEWLEVDPMPQQNTAPSFFDFVAQAPRLGWINGRRTDSYPPCFGDFDPDKPSGALPY